MAKLNVTFDVPEWVNSGLKSGEYKIFGGVIRDAAGKIVYFLKEASTRATISKNYKIIFMAAGAVVVSVVVYLLYTKINKKSKAKSLAATIESNFEKYIVNAKNQIFKISDISKLSSELNQFVLFCKQHNIDEKTIFTDGNRAVLLNEMLSAIEDFNKKLADDLTVEIPQKELKQRTNVETIEALSDSLKVQAELLTVNEGKE